MNDTPSTQTTLTAQDILGMDDLQYSTFEVPAWNGKAVLVKPFSISEREKLEGWGDPSKGAKGKKSNHDFLCLVVAMSLVNPQGERLFSDAEVSKLKEKNATAIDEISTYCLQLNGLAKTPEDPEEEEEDPNG